MSFFMSFFFFFFLAMKKTFICYLVAEIHWGANSSSLRTDFVILGGGMTNTWDHPYAASKTVIQLRKPHRHIEVRDVNRAVETKLVIGPKNCSLPHDALCCKFCLEKFNLAREKKKPRKDQTEF